MNNELTRSDFIEQLAALERRMTERFDLIERMLALGFDDTSEQIRVRLETLDVVREGVATSVFHPRDVPRSRE